jgi:hypothetical protein
MHSCGIHWHICEPGGTENVFNITCCIQHHMLDCCWHSHKTDWRFVTIGYNILIVLIFFLSKFHFTQFNYILLVWIMILSWFNFWGWLNTVRFCFQQLHYIVSYYYMVLLVWWFNFNCLNTFCNKHTMKVKMLCWITLCANYIEWAFLNKVIKWMTWGCQFSVDGIHGFWAMVLYHLISS